VTNPAYIWIELVQSYKIKHKKEVAALKKFEKVKKQKLFCLKTKFQKKLSVPMLIKTLATIVKKSKQK
jgi:hypothetical protein